MRLYTEKKYFYFYFGVGLHKVSIIHVNYFSLKQPHESLCLCYILCVVFCCVYTKILALEDYQENTERVFCNLQEEVNLYFL